MQYDAVITDYNFTPMVHGISSWLDVTVAIPALGNNEYRLERANGTFEELSRKFGFKILGQDHLELKVILGKKCIVSEVEGSYQFVRLI